MALGYLFLVFVGMSILAIVGTALLFVVKNRNASDAILVSMTAFSLIIAYLNANAQPTNFVKEQIICWIIGAVALIGTVLRFSTKQQTIVSKLLVVLSVLSGIVYLFLM